MAIAAHYRSRLLCSFWRPIRRAAMSSTAETPTCPIHLPANLSRTQLLAFPAFRTWLATLQHSLALQADPAHAFHAAPYALRSINVQAVDFFGPSRPGFVKLQADVSNDAGEKLPGAVFLRGGSVAMLIILQPDDVPTESETDKHVLLTVQPRVAAGSLALCELPAGMIDSATDTFAGTAAREIQEETGLTVATSELINMSELVRKPVPTNAPASRTKAQELLRAAIYPSPGACDEYIPLFLHERRIPRAQLQDFQGKLTGLRDEGERITLKIVKLEELWREASTDAKALGAWALYHGLKQDGKI